MKAPLFIDMHTHKRYKSDDCVFIRQGYLKQFTSPQPNYLLSKGVHPWFVHLVKEKKEALLELFAHSETAVIGECGLDRLRLNRSLQEDFFSFQISAAQELNKPLLVHNVRMHQECYSFLRGTKTPVILHAYRGNSEQSRQWLRLKNVYFSVGLRELPVMANEIPIERLFLETDTLPVSISKVYEAFANKMSLSVSQVQQQIALNFEGIFPQFQMGKSGL